MLPALRPACLVFSLLLGCASSVHADIFTVGPDPSCTHGTIAEAVLSAADTFGPDEIRIATGTGNEEWPMWYDAQQITISNQDLELKGGYVLCYYAMPDSPQPHYDPALQPYLDGAGGSAAPVIRITGTSHVTLRNLQVFRGDNTGGKGGAISFDGRGSLTLENLWLGANQAASGGGLYARGNGGALAVTLGAGTKLIGNRASQDGGAIYLEGLATLDTTSPLGTVAFNTALRDGGGFYLRGPAAMHFAFAGDSGLLGLSQNSAARHGGGAYIVGLGSSPAHVLFKSLDGNPVPVHSNQAGEAGGAVYLVNTDDTNRSSVTFRHAYVEANKAPTGAAAYQTYEASSSLHAGALYFATQGCSAGSDCNRVVGNVATSALGSTFEFHGRVEQEFSHVRFSGNEGHHLLHAHNETNSGPITYTELQTSLIVGNSYSGALIKTTGYSQLLVRSVTIADNQLGCGALFEAPDLSLLNRTLVYVMESVIRQPGCDIVALNAANAALQETNHNIVHDRDSFLASDQTSVAAPAWFVDEAFGDYRLRPGAIAVDYAPYDSPRDFDFQIRAVDGMRKNFAGLRDAGALEHVFSDDLDAVTNGRFKGDHRAWTLAAGELDPADADAGYGVPGEFSLRGLSFGTEERIKVAEQCVPLPDSGFYLLDAVALTRSSFSDAQAEDVPVVHYEVVREAESDCSSALAPLASGTMSFAPGDGWRQPVTRPVIAVTPAEWNGRAAVKIALEVMRSPGGNNTYALFDNVSLTFGGEAPPAGGSVFANGFEE